MKVLSLAALVLIIAAPAHADRLAKGSKVVWAGLNGNVAQLIGPASDESRYVADEIGLHLAYSHFVSDVWAMVLSGGLDFGSDTFEPEAAGPSIELTNKSWNARFGFDRYAFINDEVALYAGPGLLYWKGNAELKGVGDSPAAGNEWLEVSQFAFNGRLGMYARFTDNIALFGHIGQVLATNSADDTIGKRTWWSNHHEGSVGLALDW